MSSIAEIRNVTAQARRALDRLARMCLESPARIQLYATVFDRLNPLKIEINRPIARNH